MKKILIIDDDALVRMSLRNVLKKENYVILEAENGVSGMALFKKENPDLVITDMLMPNKEGLETIMEIKALRLDAKIIAISGGGSTHNMSFLQLAKKVGADVVVNKPFQPQQMLGHVKTLLGQ